MKGLHSFGFDLLLIAAFTLLCCCSQVVTANSDDICRYFPDSTKIRDPDSCNKYITCNNFTSEYTTCTGTTPFYDKDTAKCVKTAPEDDSNCHIKCTNSTGHYIADPKSCKGYYYCQDDELALYGKCPDATHFNATVQACIYRDESECHVDLFDFCQIIKDGTTFKDDSDCGSYYTCTKGVRASKACKSQYYNAATGKCVQKSQVECAVHPLPSNVCGTVKKPLYNTFVSDGATCRGYFYCRETDGPDPDPFWAQCPMDTFFNAATKTCVDPLDVKCSEDRCDGRSAAFVTSGTKGCRYYLRCQDGKTLDEGSCGNAFFDEKSGSCTNTILQYPGCS